MAQDGGFHLARTGTEARVRERYACHHVRRVVTALASCELRKVPSGGERVGRALIASRPQRRVASHTSFSIPWATIGSLWAQYTRRHSGFASELPGLARNAVARVGGGGVRVGLADFASNTRGSRVRVHVDGPGNARKASRRASKHQVVRCIPRVRARGAHLARRPLIRVVVRTSNRASLAIVRA